MKSKRDFSKSVEGGYSLPKLLVSKDGLLVILGLQCDEYGYIEGVVLHSCVEDKKLGEYCGSFFHDSFIEYKGSITLEN